MKNRILSYIVSISIILSCCSLMNITTVSAASGKCGDNVYWSFDGNGTLTISGNGNMDNYSTAEEWTNNIKKDVPWRSVWDEVKFVVIEHGVTSIGNAAFTYGSKQNFSVEIADTVTYIGEEAFYSCAGLTNIKIPDSVTEIGTYAFAWNENLVSVNLSNNLKLLGMGAFNECKNLKNIYLHEGLKIIRNNAFSSCQSLTNINIPNSVEIIEYSAFAGCCSLTDVVLPNKLDTIEDYAFMACSNLKSISIPKSVKIIELAFVWCDNLSDIYYEGNQSNWEQIYIEELELKDGSHQKMFSSSTKIHYNSNIYRERQDKEREEIKVVLNGEKIIFDQPPIMAEDRILVPIRKIAEAMGDTVMWNEEYQTAFIEHGKQALIIKLLEDNIKIVENEDWTQWKEKQLDVVAFSANGRTLVPVRAFCESLGADVKWDGDSYTAYITYNFKNKTEKMDAQTFENINTVYYALNISSTQFDEFSNDLDEFIMQRDPKIDAVAMGVSDIWAGVQDLISGFNNDVNVMQKSLETMLSNIPDNDLVKIDTKMLNDIKSSLMMNKEYYDISNGIDDKFLQKHPTLKSLNNAINTVGIAYDIASFSAQQLAVIFSNYEMNISHLYSLKTSLEENAVINNEINTAITNLENEYANKFLQIIINTRDELTKFTITEGVDLATGGVFHWGVFTWEQAFKITGATQKGQSLKTFYGLYCFNDSLDIAYKNIHRNIKTENYTKDDVLVMKHLDNIQRALKITAYEAIKNVTNDKETQIYCEKTINEKLNKSCMLWKPE